MMVFNNRDRPNYDQLIDMAPKWLNEYREMNANNRYAGWTLDLMAYWLDKIVLNLFPAYCDEEHLRMYERIFAIEYDTEPTLEERRKTVMAYWNGMGKINKSAIEQIILACGAEDPNIYWLGLYLQIEFWNTDISDESARQIRKILRRRMPAHIAYIFHAFYDAGDIENNEQMVWPRITFHSKIGFWGGITYDGKLLYDGGGDFDGNKLYNGQLLYNGDRIYGDAGHYNWKYFYNNSRRYGLGAQMRYRAEVPFFNHYFYDGRRLFDGSFDYGDNTGITYKLGLNVTSKVPAGSISQEECAILGLVLYAAIPFVSKITYDGAVNYDGSYFYGCEQVSEAKAKAVHTIPVHCAETFGNPVVISKPAKMTYFDGAVSFNGTKKYNSAIYKEALA